MEVQLTDFENAAFVVFVILLTRIILAFDLTLYIPLSKVDENMRRAHQRDGVLKEKFYFRKEVAPAQTNGGSAQFAPCYCEEGDDEYEEMTIEEILTGKGDYLLGLLPLCDMYLDYIGADRETSRRVRMYLDFIRRRGTGETLTTASWIRKYVMEHPEYQHDSVVSPSIAYDLVMKCKRIGEGEEECPEVLGGIRIDPIVAKEAYDVPLSGKRIESGERERLFAEYERRKSFFWRHHRSEKEAREGGEGEGAEESDEEYEAVHNFVDDFFL